MLSTGHPPDDDRIYYKEGRSLAKRFGSVTIVYPDHRKSVPVDSVVQFQGFPPAGGLLRRAENVRRCYRHGLEVGADVYHCHEPESLVAGLLLKRKSGAKVIFDSHEMWSAVVAGWFPSFISRFVSWFYRCAERPLVSRCDAAIGASWSIRDYLVAILGSDRTALVLNTPVAELFGGAPPRMWGDTTCLCHDGHLGFDRGLKLMAEAVRLVSRKHKVVFKIVGDVFGEARDWLDQFVAENRLESTILRTGWLPYDEVGQALASCHIGLIGLQPSPNNTVTSSNKVFNYMLYGIPFVGPRFRLSKIRLVREESCGVLADSTSPESYAEAICKMIENREETLRMAARASRASEMKYRWEHMEARLIALYEKVLEQ